MKRMIALLIACLMLLSFTACRASSASGGSAGEAMNAINIGCPIEADSLDPYATKGTYAMAVKNAIYERLVKEDEEGNIEGLLAESWTLSEDGMALTFKLRSGVNFHNGQELTAEDVLFSFRDQWLTSTQGASENVFDFANMSINGDFEVVIPLFAPTSNALYKLANEPYYIMNKEFVEEIGDQISVSTCGTGPYCLDVWKQGDVITLTRNKSYWGSQPQFETVNFKLIPENAQRETMLELGELDLSFEPDFTDVERVINQEVTGLKYIQFPSSECYILYFNYNHEIWNNLALRQAVTVALDKAAIARACFGETLGVAATSSVSSGLKYYANVDDGTYDYDVEKAKEYLAQAGYAPGELTLELYLDTSSVRATMAQIIKNQLEQIGINVNITALEGATFGPLCIEEGQVQDMMLMGNGSNTGEAYGSLYREITTNLPDYDKSSVNSEFDSISDKVLEGVHATTEELAAAAYEEAQREIYEKVVYVPILEFPCVVICGDYLDNVFYYYNTFFVQDITSSK